MTGSPDKPESNTDRSGERLQKVLAAAGLGSRRHCEEYIVAGRVCIDGQVASQLGVKVDLDRQKVTVDGERIKPQTKRYYLVHKPTGCLCTNDDPAGRTRVVDLLPPSDTRLFTVGRLDENTEGLLLVTNDGDLAHRLAHPKFQVERVYRVLVAGHPDQKILDDLQQGLHFAEGKFRVRQARKLKTQGQSTLLELVLTEGQNREVRRMFARVGHKVMLLQRIQFGPLRLSGMEPGEFRPLRPQELDKLRELVTGGGAAKKRYPRPRPGAGPRKAARPAGRWTAERTGPPRASGAAATGGVKRSTKSSRPSGPRKPDSRPPRKPRG
ncbi:MAG TPA: pseudouridine synthase [Planctomycetaceae bacterium]|nr:pseudouridine synthase [Planctomycetaceae bacterium]